MKTAGKKKKGKADNQDEINRVADLPGFFLMKDTNLIVTAITKACAQLCGWKKPDDAIGHNDYDMPSAAAESAEDFLKLDQLSVSSGKKLHSIQVIRYDSDWKVILTERNPVTDDNQNVTKLHITAMDITDTFLSRGIIFLDSEDRKMIQKVNQPANYIISSYHRPFPLTEKQELCLFLLVRGKSMKQIASILNISTKTVEDHINAIKTKLNCHSKSQIIERALEEGFFYHLPKALL